EPDHAVAKLRRRLVLHCHRRPPVEAPLLPPLVLRLEDRERVVPAGELARPRVVRVLSRDLRRRLTHRRRHRLTRGWDGRGTRGQPRRHQERPEERGPHPPAVSVEEPRHRPPRSGFPHHAPPYVTHDSLHTSFVPSVSVTSGGGESAGLAAISARTRHAARDTLKNDVESP